MPTCVGVNACIIIINVLRLHAPVKVQLFSALRRALVCVHNTGRLWYKYTTRIVTCTALKDTFVFFTGQFLLSLLLQQISSAHTR